MGVHDTDKYKQVRKALSIPEDEPIFIIRGQDKSALPMLARYRNFAVNIEGESQPNEDWFKSLDEHIAEFQTWQTENKNKVKIPD